MKDEKVYADAADLELQIDMLEEFDANSDDKYNTLMICWLKELQQRRALQSGNSAQPVMVPAGYVLVPVEPTPEMCDVGHIGIDVLTGVTSDSEYYSTWGDSAAKLYRAMLAAAPKAPGDQLTPAPEDRLQKAIFNACIVFLYGCGNGYKNHEGHFYDVETEHSFCIWEIAEQIGVVKETGNYKWSLCKEMEDDIEEVYRKYAMRIMEAAPKVTP